MFWHSTFIILLFSLSILKFPLIVSSFCFFISLQVGLNIWIYFNIIWLWFCFCFFVSFPEGLNIWIYFSISWLWFWLRFRYSYWDRNCLLLPFWVNFNICEVCTQILVLEKFLCYGLLFSLIIIILGSLFLLINDNHSAIIFGFNN